MILVLLVSLLTLLVPAVPARGQSESTPPAAPSEPSSPPAPTPQPAERPFVPPQPPAPSQTRIPAAFPEALLTQTGPPIELHPTVSLIEAYTDNFNNTARSGAQSNFRTTLRGGLNTIINAPRTSGFINLNVAANHDSSNDEQLVSVYTYGLTGFVRHVFDPRLSLTISDTLNHTDDFSEGDAEGLRTERREFTSNTLGVTVNWLLDLVSTQGYYRVSTFFSRDRTVSHILGVNATTPIGALNTLHVGYEFTDRSTESRVTTTDTIGHRVFGAFNRRLGAYTTVGVSSSYSMASTGDTDHTIWNGSLTGSYGVPMGLTMSTSTGVSVSKSDPGNTSIGFSTNTLLAYHWAFATASLGVFQDLRQTSDEGQDFGTVVTRSIKATFTYQLTPFISTALRGSFSRNETTGEGNSVTARAQTTFGGGASLTWQIARWLRMSLDYAYTQRQSDNKTELTTSSSANSTREGGGSQTESTENRATLTLTATF